MSFSKQRIERRLQLRRRNRRNHDGLQLLVEKNQALRRKEKESKGIAGVFEAIKAKAEKFSRRLDKFRAKAVK